MSGRLLWIAALLEHLGREWWRSFREATRRRRQWPTLAAPPRGCPFCQQIAYTPGQSRCYRCGAIL